MFRKEICFHPVQEIIHYSGVTTELSFDCWFRYRMTIVTILNANQFNNYKWYVDPEDTALAG